MLSMCVLIMNKFYDASNKALINFKMTLNCCFYVRSVCTYTQSMLHWGFIRCSFCVSDFISNFIRGWRLLLRDCKLNVLLTLSLGFSQNHVSGVDRSSLLALFVGSKLQDVVSLYLICWTAILRLEIFVQLNDNRSWRLQKGQLYWELGEHEPTSMRLDPQNCQFQKTFQHVLLNQFIWGGRTRMLNETTLNSI